MIAHILLVLLLCVPALAGGRGAKRDSGLAVLRGDLLEGGALHAPFSDPGAVVGRFVVRSSHHRDLRVDPAEARLHVPGGALRARVADPSEDADGLLELCRLGLSPFVCLSLPLSPGPSPVSPIPPIPLIPLNSDPVGLSALLTPQEQALLGCGAFYGTECEGTLLLPLDPIAGGQQQFGRRDFVWLGPDGEVVTIADPGSGRPGGGTPLFDPTTGFQSELAALSWNALMALVALSTAEGLPGEDDFDPSDPFRTDGCSFAQPALCRNVAPIGSVSGPSWRFAPLPDDPRGTGDGWLWDSAIAYEVVQARGNLAGFRGGRLYVYGPFESEIEGSASGVGLLLVPPPGVEPDAASALAWLAPGPDRLLGTQDDRMVGLGWGAAWPGFDGISSRPRPKPHGRARGHAAGLKAGAGGSGSPAGRRAGRP